MFRLAVVQTDLFWESPEENRKNLSSMLLANKDADLFVLPEMFTTGFSMNNKKNSESSNGETVQWMQDLSVELAAAITGSLIIEENGSYFNRLFWVEPNGTVKHYDKRHLFRMANEHQYYSEGVQRLVVNWKGVNFAPFICYDLRFPVWSRNLNLEYDVAIYVANWPAARRHAWKSLLVGRAIENQSYAVGVNRIGFDGEERKYSGDSCVVDFEGNYLLDASCEKGVFIQEISIKNLKTYRKQFPAYIDSDEYTLKI